eukprot:6417854-Pyramimonas_sp.AAC.1
MPPCLPEVHGSSYVQELGPCHGQYSGAARQLIPSWCQHRSIPRARSIWRTACPSRRRPRTRT